MDRSLLQVPKTCFLTIQVPAIPLRRPSHAGVTCPLEGGPPLLTQACRARFPFSQYLHVCQSVDKWMTDGQAEEGSEEGSYMRDRPPWVSSLESLSSMSTERNQMEMGGRGRQRKVLTPAWK